METVWLLVDSGGSKTHFVLTDPEGNFLKEAFSSGVGKSVDPVDEPLEEFSCEVRKLCRDFEVSCAAANLGGKNEFQLRRVLEECLPDAQIYVLRESSGVLADAMREAYHADVIVLLGTGAITIGSGPKGKFIADGWGCNIGDVASGYWIGMEAIRRSLNMLEMPEHVSSLASEITGRGEVFSPVADGIEMMRMRDAVRSHIGLPLERARVADFARTVRKHAEAGDILSLGILDDAGTGLADTVVRTLNVCGAGRTPHVLVVGGVASMAHLWGHSFERRLKNVYPGASWEARHCDILEGALAYAKKQMNRSEHI